MNNFHSTNESQTTISSENKNNNKTNKLASYLASYHNNNNNNKTIASRVDPVLYDEAGIILRREKKTFQDWLNEQILNLVKEHSDGNPVYTLEHFSDENFLATPAYHRPLDIWENYLMNCSKGDWKKFYQQLEELNRLERKVGRQR